MPLLSHIGFNFSKFAEVSPEIITNRSKDFTKYKFPVDVLWLDIDWAKIDF